MIDFQLQRILGILDQFKTMDYIGEEVSQLEHALQSAYFAEHCGHGEAVIIASLLHDIGHIASTTPQPQMAELGVINHEWIGAKLTREMGFSIEVAQLIGHHVNAKRYLAAKKPQYYQRLSDASKGTLAYQGGPMSPSEMNEFESLPYFKQILQMRANDEKGKVVDLDTPPLTYFAAIMRQHLTKQLREFTPKPKELYVLGDGGKFTPTDINKLISHYEIDLSLSSQPQAISSTIYYDYNLSVTSNMAPYIAETLSLIQQSCLTNYLVITSDKWIEHAQNDCAQFNIQCNHLNSNYETLDF